MHASISLHHPKATSFSLTPPLTAMCRSQEEMAHTCRGTVNLTGAFIDNIDTLNFVITNGPQVCLPQYFSNAILTSLPEDVLNNELPHMGFERMALCSLDQWSATEQQFQLAGVKRSCTRRRTCTVGPT